MIKIQYKVFVFVVEHSPRWPPLQDILKLEPTMSKKNIFLKSSLKTLHLSIDILTGTFLVWSRSKFISFIKDGEHCWIKKNTASSGKI